MNQHHALRYGNEWQCDRCGKSWHVKDTDIPDCIDTSTKDYKLKRLQSIRQELHNDEKKR